MKILVSIPSISYKMAYKCDGLFPFHDIMEFEPSGPRNLDVFAENMSDLELEKVLGINVPHWPLKEKGCQGVAGPGLPSDELFWPSRMESILTPRAGSYDKWRPYPAQKPLTEYNVSMASRYSFKRRRMFALAADKLKWETLIYVEHAPSSLAHLDRVKAIEIADKVIREAVNVWGEAPYSDLVIFSPYGPAREPGFVVSSGSDTSIVGDWRGIRRYLERGF